MDTIEAIGQHPCPPIYVWMFERVDQVSRFVRLRRDFILETLTRWQCSEAIFRSNDAQPIRMPKEMIEEMQPVNPVLYYAHVALPPTIVRATLDLMENPRKAGISRAHDGLQVVMSSLCQELNPGHTMSEATEWTRSDFWHPQDLSDFNREARQTSGTFEFRWRSFDPALGMNDPTPGNWLEFRTRYRQVQGEDGVIYQICENLEMNQITIAHP
jgi:hypothetical protein